MAEFNIFVTLMLSDLSTFLMSEPIVWFLGLAILAFIVKILSSFFRSSCRF